MAQELEAKFHVANFRAVRKSLRKLGTVYCGTAIQRDRFFDTPDRRIYGSGSGMRIRTVRILRRGAGGLEAQPLLTYKGPLAANRRTKVRSELQTRAADADALTEILRVLGFDLFVTIEKRRASYKLGRCAIELDELPLLGRFVEIEAPTERMLDTVRRKLALTDDAVVESYLHMAGRRCPKINDSCFEITFNRCGCCGAAASGAFA